MTGNSTPVSNGEGPAPHRRRYQLALLQAFLSGQTVEEACVSAKVSRRTRPRWRNENGAELEEARWDMVGA